MASKQLPPTMDNLPCDVLSNIFVRLMAKQLAQMRCVSKSWNALLSHSSFVKSHLHRSIHRNDEILLVFHPGFSFGWKPFTAHPSQSPYLELTNIIKLPVENESVFTSGGCVIGSVNGLICFEYGSYGGSAIHIWNPSLSAVLTLPPYSMPSHNYDLIETLFRFGFDPKTNDYKVVKLTSLLRPPTTNRLSLMFGTTTFCVVKEWLQVKVYSMRKGCWELIPARPPSHITKNFKQDEVFVDGHDGHLHWLGYIDEELKLQTIVAFDLGVETFCEIPLPNSILSYQNVLGVLGGKLCVMSTAEDGEYCEVWVMDEYGVAESWVKHQVFSQFSGFIAPFGFTLHNEFLFEAYNNRLVLYDPIAAKSKSFKIMSRLLGITKVVVYVDSLVWITPAQSETNCCSISQLKFEKSILDQI